MNPDSTTQLSPELRNLLIRVAAEHPRYYAPLSPDAHENKLLRELERLNCVHFCPYPEEFWVLLPQGKALLTAFPHPTDNAATMSASLGLEAETARDQLPHVLEATHFDGWLGTKSEGKARDNYPQDGALVIVATDRVSAFDRNLGCIPFKGQVVTQMSEFWFQQTRDIVPNHLIAVPDPNAMVVTRCEVLPVEVVVRAYLTGVTPTSIWYQYARGTRTFCGHTLPGGLKKNHRLPAPIITPSTKAPKGTHDESISRADVLTRSLLDNDTLERVSAIALSLFARGTELAAERGIILVDTKYEFGRDSKGNILLIDEVHTPDSSRFWYSDTYQHRFERDLEQDEHDKEFIRIWLAAQGFDGKGSIPQIPAEVFVDAALRYLRVARDILGRSLTIEVGDPSRRIETALRSYFGR